MATQREIAEALDTGVLGLGLGGYPAAAGKETIIRGAGPTGAVDRAALRRRGLSRKQVEAAGRRARRQLASAAARADAEVRRGYGKQP